MQNSVFYDVISIQNNKESSAFFIKMFSDVYEPTNRRFVFNKNVSFSFCAHEVADVLGIKNSGVNFTAPAAKNVPEFVYDLMKGCGLGSSRIISTTTIKKLLSQMDVNDDESRFNFKKLLSYFLIEIFLIPSPDSKKPRTSAWEMVEDLDAYEEVNWAEAITDDLHVSFNKLKNAMKTGLGKQHKFKGCAPVFEAVVFERIPSLKPKPSSFPYPPIQKYESKRKDWKPLETMEAYEIIPCPWCVAAKTEENKSLTEDVAAKTEKNESLTENVAAEMEKNESLTVDVAAETEKNESLTEDVAAETAKNESLKKDVAAETEENESLTGNVASLSLGDALALSPPKPKNRRKLDPPPPQPTIPRRSLRKKTIPPELKD
ncbi:uncharacterized protein LOC131651267 [Vicia villosa]|uniref:uncharacterized protein LOC131651267 n=1 Tax=Vicia villosa TaxID=3911 RepID=UPI00273AA09A|nr:uncharacterized protein LOC131651267 [Vicia villosa]